MLSMYICTLYSSSIERSVEFNPQIPPIELCSGIVLKKKKKKKSHHISTLYNADRPRSRAEPSDRFPLPSPYVIHKYIYVHIN